MIDLELKLEKEYVEEVRLPFGGEKFTITVQEAYLEFLTPAANHEAWFAVLGRVNRMPLRFRNYLAHRECLLIHNFDANAIDTGYVVRVNCHLMHTISLCEDGVTRHVGWNRVFTSRGNCFARVLGIEIANRPACFPPLTKDSPIYPYAEDEERLLYGERASGYELLGYQGAR